MSEPDVERRAQTGFTLESVLPRLTLPAYLATVLTRTEEQLIARDVALHAGEDDVARAHDEEVAGLLCIALGRAADEVEIPPDIDLNPRVTTFLHGDKPPPGSDLTREEFRRQELALLHLVGLGRGLAEKYVTEAFALSAPPAMQIDSKARLEAAVNESAAAACEVHRSIAQQRRAAADQQRRRRFLRRLSVMGGGILIVVTNTAAVPLIGPFGLAASAALGGGAAGAAANLVER